jgi:hypothetical protein
LAIALLTTGYLFDGFTAALAGGATLGAMMFSARDESSAVT